MQLGLVVFTLIFPIFDVRSLIVPDEIPTILSVIYSNIPILKKGTDSRLGWGFRLGNRADFQVLVELGPQTYTQPLANQGDGGGNSKRNALNTLSNTLYAQRQKEKADTAGGKWLEVWSENVRQKQMKEQGLPPGARPGIAVGEVDAKSVIPDDSTLRLAELYEKTKDSSGKVSKPEGGEREGGEESDSTTVKESE